MKTVLAQAIETASPVYAVYHRGDLRGVLVPEEESLMMSEWPTVSMRSGILRQDEFVMERVKAVTRGIRNMRAEMDVPNNRKTNVYRRVRGY